MSGYGRTIKVVNLKPELSPSITQSLTKIMYSDEQILKKLIDNLGFNFQIIIDWIDDADKNIDGFIKEHVKREKLRILDLFKGKKPLLDILITRDLKDFDYSMEELEFLQKVNIINKSKDYSLEWHDKIVEKVFEELKKVNT